MGGFFLRSLAGGVLTGVILGSLAYAQATASQSVVSADSASSAPATTRSSVTPVAVTPENADIVVDPASLLPDLPTLPPTKASLIGGTIQRVDRVRDELTVRVFGGGKMKVFFDTRTHIYNGNALGATPDLRVGDRVYLDTILDAGNIFARNIRLATQTAGGKSQGVVISYQSGKNELLLRDLLSPEAVKLRLTPNTQVVQDGHAAYANQLVPGTLVDVDFISQKDDRDAQKISILAVPGTDFTFAGVVTSLDLHIGLLVLTSQTDRKTYEIYLDPAAITVDDGLHAGANVTTVARFDGSRYVARTLTVNSH
ncbi:MAG: hypothetical protein WB814_03010 [Candidatus Sulfotelmatobacter sp.]|jgi:hypothetical protein